jgi:hypothetical protein
MRVDDKKLRRLAAAERLYDLRLKEAQLAQSEAERALEAEESKRKNIELEIESLALYRRGLAGHHTPLDAARLDLAQRYAGWVEVRLDEQVAALEQARNDRDAKHDRTRGCFEDIAVLKRACERREALLETDRQRAAQKLLDAHAALKHVAKIRNEDSD